MPYLISNSQRLGFEMEVWREDSRIIAVSVLDTLNEESCRSEEIREHNNSKKANEVQHIVKTRMQTQAIYDVYWPIILVSKDLNLRDHWMQSVNSYVPFCCGLTKVAEFLTHSLSWWQMSLSAVFAQVSVPLTQSAKGASHFLTYCSQCPCWPLCAQYLSKTKSTQQVDSDKPLKKARKLIGFAKFRKSRPLSAFFFVLQCLH